RNEQLLSLFIYDSLRPALAVRLAMPNLEETMPKDAGIVLMGAAIGLEEARILVGTQALDWPLAHILLLIAFHLIIAAFIGSIARSHWPLAIISSWGCVWIGSWALFTLVYVGGSRLY